MHPFIPDEERAIPVERHADAPLPESPVPDLSFRAVRRFLQDLAATDVCERCGKSRHAIVTQWHGRGTGVSGSTVFGAKETTDHCICPPVAALGGL